jgi:hypothetical protein
LTLYISGRYTICEIYLSALMRAPTSRQGASLSALADQVCCIVWQVFTGALTPFNMARTWKLTVPTQYNEKGDNCDGSHEDNISARFHAASDRSN